MEKYKLLKDHLGWDAGTEFWLVSPCPESSTQFTPYYSAHGNLEGSLPVKGVEGTPALFAPIDDTPAPLYPWTPTKEEFYWYVAEYGFEESAWEDDSTDEANTMACNIWRTQEHAEKVQAAQKVLHKAMQAFLNREGWEPKMSDTVWHVSEGQRDNPLSVASDPFLSDSQYCRYMLSAGHYWPTEDAAQAWADLANIPHDLPTK